MSDARCGNCRFFGAYANQIREPMPFGECRRFPQPVRKLVTEWCGEHKPAEEVAAPEPGAVRESNANLRARLRVAAGDGGVNAEKIEQAEDEKLDEVASFYGITRR